MLINEEIPKILREWFLPVDDGIVYLLSLYFKRSPSYFPQSLILTMNRTGIYYIDEYNSFAWRVPLFSDIEETPWSWVKTEYVQLFKNANPDKAGNGNDSVRRMKKLFANYPDIRKDEILGATTLYITNNDPQYIRLSHYFIEKGKGADLTQDILTWIEKYREQSQSTSRTNLMQ